MIAVPALWHAERKLWASELCCCSGTFWFISEIRVPWQAAREKASRVPPRFMESVDEIRQDGPKKLFWKAKIAGKDKKWEAEITEQVPDKRVACASVDG